MRRVTLAGTLILPLLAIGCGEDPFFTQTAPTGPVQIVTDTFTGTVQRNGATTHPFSVVSSAGGAVAATLKAINPDGESVVGMSLGTWNGSACQAIIANDRATVSVSILGQATAIGTLCVRIYDVGALDGAQDYEVEVTHP